MPAPGLEVGAGALPDPLHEEVLRRLAQIESRLTETQAMAARAYEAVGDWPAAVRLLRTGPGYEEPFHGEPLISVRIATYNAADVLCERAIASLRLQTYGRWEAIVIGDACTDDTESRLEAIGDPRISFRNLPFRGPYPEDAKARWYVAGGPPANAGIEAARGGWIAPLDHDDEWDDDHIEVLLAEAQRTRAEIVYGRIRTIDEHSGSRGEMGRWPPERGQFGFLGSLQHRGLRRFRYDPNCRFADEPGDWNLARRLWEAGVRFAFVDRAVATHYHTPRHASLTTEQRMIQELRTWARELEEARDFWHEQAERWEQVARSAGAGDPPQGGA